MEVAPLYTLLTIAVTLAAVFGASEAMWIKLRQSVSVWDPMPHGALLAVRVALGILALAIVVYPCDLWHLVLAACGYWAAFTITHRLTLNIVAGVDFWYIGRTSTYDRLLRRITRQNCRINPWQPFALATAIEGGVLVSSILLF